MSDISEVAQGVYLIATSGSLASGPAGLPTSSLIYYIAGHQPALVETGPTAGITELIDALGQIGDPLAISYAILTHIHLDHAGGAGAITRSLPNAKIVVHQRGARHLVDPGKLVEASRQAFGDQFEEQYGPILPVPEQRIRAVDDNEVIDIADRELQFIYSPGHASHHMCIWDGVSRGLFCGEALGRPQGTVVAPVAGFDPDAALATIERLATLPVERAFYSHGGVSLQPSSLIESVRSNMAAYRRIILEYVKTGESIERVKRRLVEFQKTHPGGDTPMEHQIDDLVTWHIAYFKRKGLI